MNESLNELDLLEILRLLVPEGTNQGCSSDNGSISIKNENGKITIECSYKKDKKDNETHKVFDDSSTKELVSDFKESILALDDAVFIESIRKAKDAINIKRFDSLLKNERFTESEAIEIECLINYFSQIILDTLKEKIEELVNLSEKF